MLISSRSRLLIPLLLAASLCGVAVAQDRGGPDKVASRSDWPCFLGPSRDGRLPAHPQPTLIDAWPQDGPKELWRISGGVGMSGLAISGQRVVTMIQTDGMQRVLCVDAKTGKKIWETEVAPEYRNQMGNGPRATPAIHGKRVFVHTGQGILAALDLPTGKIAWKKNVLKDLGGKPADYGMASSPLTANGSVIVTIGAPGATLASFGAETGELRWKAGSDRAGYSSPVLRQIGTGEKILAFTGQSVIAVAPTSGDVSWRYPYETDFDCNIAVPLAWGKSVFISSGENHGCVLLDLEKEPKTGEAPKAKWTSFGPKSVMRNEWQTSVLIDGHLYGFDNAGSAGPVTHLNCVDIAAGKRVWQELRFGKGNLIAGDGKLFIVTMKGVLVIARATPKGYEELGRKKVVGRTRQAPSIAHGRLFLRDDREIVCLDVSGPPR